MSQVHHTAGPGVQEPEPEQLEDAGEDRDVAEARGERGEVAQRAVELLLVAEASSRPSRAVAGHVSCAAAGAAV